MNLWRYTTTINSETTRSPKSFFTSREGLKHLVDSAHALARTFSGGRNTTVSQPLEDDRGNYIVVVQQNDDEVARFELTKIRSDDSLVRFKLNHPYLHEVLSA